MIEGQVKEGSVSVADVAKEAISGYLAALQDVEAEAVKAVLPFDVQNREMGLSGAKLIAALQKLTELSCAESKRCYVEVGTYRGLTLLSVASANPDVLCYGIDNFSQFDVSGRNERLIGARIASADIRNAALIKSDFEAAFEDLNANIGDQKIGCYMVDGPHDYRSQLVCLTLARKYLAPGAVIFIDDSNYEHVRQANKDFLLAFPEFKLLFEAYGPAHPDNLAPAEHAAVRSAYWNGINILVHDPNDTLSPIYPATSPDRTRYVNDHIVHSSWMAEVAPEALQLVEAGLRPWRLPRAGARFLRAWLRQRGCFGQRYARANTNGSRSMRIAGLR